MSTVETAFAPAPSPTEAGMDDVAIRRARVDFAAVHRIIVHENMHEGTWNHFSCKVPGRPGHLLITPGQMHFSRVTAGNLVEVGPDGRPVGGEARLNVSAWAIHDPIQRARPDIVCALHIHAPYSTALASIEGWRLEERGARTRRCSTETAPTSGTRGSSPRRTRASAWSKPSATSACSSSPTTAC